MNDTALKNFATWARTTLMDGVRLRMAYYLVDDGTDADAAATVDGTLLSEQQRRQRADLLRIVREGGADALVERAAYTWFNRIAAIRFMELNDRLPCGMRLLSTKDGAFDRRTQAVEEALVIEIEGLDRQKVLEAIQSSDDERLFRVLFLAQCAELSACMPAVFEPIGSAMELLLPVNLFAQDGLIQHLVEDIPEDDWREGVEIVGWLYQYYNADCKDEFFGSKRKASAADIPYASQLFTPEWIVRYLAENSLGRLWMLNHPDSKLAESMKYYLAPEDGEHEEFRRITSPEEIEVCDPACGSGHILVAAFDLLAIMYEEAGYVCRDVPRLILEKNLTGFEIDPRAAQLASFALSMKACEVDHRFLRRAVAPHIVVLEPVELDEGDLARVPQLAKCKSLLDAMAHLNECGSLFAPEPDDLQAIKEAIASCGDATDLFADATREKLQKMSGLCRELSRTFDAVIANPPYMGLKKLGAWYYGWLSKDYPTEYFDLYACFIRRSFAYAPGSYSALVTMFTWATDKSFLRMREDLIFNVQIIALLHMAPLVMPIAFDTSATIFFSKESHPLRGKYTKVVLDDLEEGVLKQIPKKRWFKHAMSAFRDIPELVFAYWASDAVRKAFGSRETVGSLFAPRVGIQTGDTGRFLRNWWEVEAGKRLVPDGLNRSHLNNRYRWIPYNNAGDYRKWYGNNYSVLKWDNEGEEVIGFAEKEKRKVMNLPKIFRYKQMVSWNDYGLGQAAFRFSPSGYLFDVIEPAFIDSEEKRLYDLIYLLAFGNSSVANCFITLLMPGRHKNVGKMAQLPLCELNQAQVCALAHRNISISIADWDSHETSWDFKRHPLV